MTDYRALDPSLPDIGWNRPLPRPVTADAARAIHAADDAAALGMMAGALRSFVGAGGLVGGGLFAGLACAVLGWHVAAAAIWALAAVAAMGVIEARRRAQQWLGVIEARLTTLRTRGE